MIKKLDDWLEVKKEHWRYRYLPHIVDSLIDMSNSLRAAELRRSKATRILIDNSVLGKGVVQETGWINTGKKMWGSVEIDTGYAARIPVYHDNDETEVARSVRYLPAISRLAVKERIRIFSSSELRDETWTQPSGRYTGYRIYDYNLFSQVRIETIKDPDYFMMMGPATMGIPSLVDQRMERLAAKNDELYRGLVDALGKANSQDCYHIAFAERNDIYCFLTMDFKLIKNLQSRRRHPIVAGLKTKVLSPEQFGIKFQLMPVSTRLFSHHRASFPVAWWESWPKSGRKPRGRRPKTSAASSE